MHKSVLFFGENYYMNWYLSRELRKLGWRADVLSMHPQWDSYSHGADFRISISNPIRLCWFIFRAFFKYNIFVFSGFILLDKWYFRLLVKLTGKKVVYIGTGCNDGNLKSSVLRDIGLCHNCGWPPEVCSEEITRKKGENRNRVVNLVYAPDLLFADYNSPSFVDFPFYFCINSEVWRPDLLIPANHRLYDPPGTIRIFHGMANVENRSFGNKNAKGSPAVVEAVTRLKAEGFPVELIYVTGLPSKDVRYYMAQSDLVIDQLHYGWVGSTAREAMAMGKPVIAKLNPDWIKNINESLPDYEFPVIHATVDTIYDVLKDLILHPEKRAEAGTKSRSFALRWLDCAKVARILDVQWEALLNGQTLTIRSGALSKQRVCEIMDLNSENC